VDSCCDQSAESDVLTTLVDNHRAFLAFLERRVGNRALAEDLLQSAFAKGIERAGELRDGEAVVAWFYRLLRNAVIDHRRREDVAGRSLEAFAAEMEKHEAPPEELRGAICQCVRRLAGTLKPEYADILQRVDIDGLAVKDFADERGISSSNAAVRAFRARDALRQQVVRSCGTCAEHGCVECCCDSRIHGA
jgi:RNA polymerase sigma-70 factor (ECF subfamily)